MNENVLTVQMNKCISRLVYWLKELKERQKNKRIGTNSYKGLFIDLIIKDDVYTGEYENVGIYVQGKFYNRNGEIPTNTKRIIISKYNITPEKIRNVILNEFKLSIIKERIKDIEKDF